jgi:uncharacterized protein
MMTVPVDFKAKQKEFTQYIRDPNAYAAPSDVKPERIAMYRELIFNNIDGFLASNFPVIRQILDDKRWYELAQDFFSKHTCKTPYFSEIAEEFLDFLENERDQADDFPFLLELAHYEWVEMALSIAKEDIDSPNLKIDDLISCTIKLSPLAWPLVYRYPVQLISPEYLPSEAPDQPTCLIAYRDLDDEVKFVEINPITYRMLEVIQEQGQITTADCLSSMAIESNHPNPDIITAGGLQILKELVDKNVILVCQSD